MRGVLVVGGLLAAGCTALKASQVSPGSLSGDTFSPGRAVATAYGPSAAYACRGSDVLQVMASQAPAPSAQDGQLCGAAEALLGWSAADPPPAALLDFVAWSHGLPSPPRLQAMVSTFTTEEPEAIAGAFKDALETHAKGSRNPRYGAAVLRLKKGSVRVAVVMQDLPLEVTAPRTLQAGGSAHVKGRLLGGEAATVTWSNEKGEGMKPASGGAADFDVEISCASRGRLVVEVQGSQGTRATLPVACGEAAPSSVKLAADGAEPARRVFDELNAERAAAGLAALEWDAAVADAARAAAEALRDASGTVADPTPFLRQAKAQAALVVENPGQALGVAEAHRAFSLSPSLRANYMSPLVTHGGVGVAPGPELHGQKTVFAVELFVKRQERVDPAKVAAELAKKIADRRAAAKVTALATDPQLEKAAQQYADALAASKGALADDKANAFLSGSYKAFAALNVMSGARVDPISVADEASITGKGTHVGIGVAQGEHGSFGPNTAYVVVLIGTRR